MESPRSAHSSTVLPDGRVLVAGGEDEHEALATAELYDPQARTWSRTADMAVARTLHTATLLNDGRVLVTGGCRERVCGNGLTAMASAELFDPSAVDVATGRQGTWTPTGDLTDARFSHTATLLADGRVLVAGGCRGRFESFCGPNSPEHLRSAEVYDANAIDLDTGRRGAWRPTGQLFEAEGRAFHSATPLPDGKVLVAGGRVRDCLTNAERTARNTAEIYDPDAVDSNTGVRGVWQPTAPMAMGRFWHSATSLADGRVLVAGGVRDYPDYSNPFCSFVNIPREAPSTSAEIYDPQTGSWQPAASMEGQGRFLHSLTLLASGEVMAAGGNVGPLSGSEQSLATAELFDPAGIDATTGAIGTWRPTGSLITSRGRRHAASLLPGGMVLVSGGIDKATESVHLATAEVFDRSLTTQPPSVVSVSPAQEPTTSGGVRVTLRGAGFTGVSGVRFGEREATFAVRSEGEIVTDSPPVGGPGTVHITVTTQQGSQPEQTSDAVNTARYTYGGSPGGPRPPFLEAVRPVTGPEAGGTAVTITGTDLDGVAEVVFGVAKANFIVESASRVLAAAPPGTGTVEVRVRSATGLSLTKGVFTYVDGSPSWSETGSLASPRVGHTMTVLSGRLCEGSAPAPYCGKVLVAGGSDDASLTSAELWDPTTGKWCQEPDADLVCPEPLNVARHSHAATALDDGRVLVVGHGFTGTNDTSLSAELYDPTTGTWEEIDGPTLQRGGSLTVTLLDDGTVLAVGNSVVPSQLPERAEVFDPRTQQWKLVGAMQDERSQHTATRLADGRVLVVGGYATGETQLSSAEVYDPKTEAWSATGSLVHGRKGHSSTLLSDGKVLVAGGCCDVNRRPLASAELYDPAANSGAGAWTLLGAMGAPRIGHTSTRLVSGEVLVAGGCCEGGNLASAELYDPATKVFRPTASLANNRSQHTAAALGDGRVLVAGGDPQKTASRSAEVYARDPLAPQIASIEPPASGTAGRAVIIRGRHLMPSPGVSFGGTAADVTFASDRYMVVRAPAHPQGTVEVGVRTVVGRGAVNFTYGPGDWTKTDPLVGCNRVGPCQQRHFHTATTLKSGKVLVVGGCCAPGVGASAQLFDPSARTWTGTGGMRVERVQHTATLLADGRVLVAGGNVSDTRAEVYDPATGQWLDTDVMVTAARLSATATLLADGRVLVTGGAVNEVGRTPTGNAELYDPTTGRWTPTSAMAIARGNHSATLLTDGRVMVAGGVGERCPDPTAGVCVPVTGSTRDITYATVLDSAEIFDPRAGSWLRTGSLGVARFSHSGTLLAGTGCAGTCGKVLVAGGNSGGGPISAAELFDPASGAWTATSSLETAMSGHVTGLLADGTVVAAGNGLPFLNNAEPTRVPPLAEAQVYDPVSGTWRVTASMNTPRHTFAAALLDQGACGDHCGDVLVVGGVSVGGDTGTAELYTPAPRVLSVTPQRGTAGGGTVVDITGHLFSGARAVTFGGVPASSFTVVSPTRITAIAPPRAGGPAQVAVVGKDGQTSAHITPSLSSVFRFVGSPGGVAPVQAEALSTSAIRLRFPAAAASDGEDPPAATRYVVNQSPSAEPDSGTPLCEGGECSFTPTGVGQELELSVGELEPATTYYYSVQAKNEFGVLGPISDTASATTHLLEGRNVECPPAAPGSGQVLLPGGRYALVGLPAGTVVPVDSPLYGWLDLGAGGTYAVQAGSEPVDAGKGYWAFSFCDKVVTLSGPGEPRATMPLGAYHASMVGNPSGTSPASVTGHDFAARWDPSANAAAGGYQVSGYREAQPLAVGEGLWVFSYSGTTVDITAGT